MLVGNCEVNNQKFSYVPPVEHLSDLPETISVRLPSYTNMKLPPDFFCGQEDDQFREVAAERRLYLTVFQFAFEDLIGWDKTRRDSAIRWFKGQYRHASDEVSITFKEVVELFQFSDTRMDLIRNCIKHGPGGLGRTFRDGKRRPNHRMGK